LSELPERERRLLLDFLFLDLLFLLDFLDELLLLLLAFFLPSYLAF